MRRQLTALELSYQLSDLPDRATYLAAACASLHEAIGCDRVGWTDIDLTARSAEIWTDPPADELEKEVFAQVMPECPTVRHYRRHPTSFEPYRVSDLVSEREWRSNLAYCEHYRPLGLHHQLAVSLPPRTTTRGTGWYLNRSNIDFTEDHVALARSLVPVLAVLNRVYSAPIIDREQAREQAGLTPRELDVLTLLAQGLTARQIATLRRIGVRTVSKHLEHLYRKLGCNDRLQAVNKARQLSLIRDNPNAGYSRASQ
ncbi:response regulator transcription factor [Actinoallomurus rhizosphaericola]|uniref:response regulator transcription factor n=1 Tax=Actinoallomurus rhizosphaericola TaxID=2952536 RepID=UPI0020920A1E|nr:LuxR C-terminal-related transcriptional regulator [Actinoallomurus rhizosphaericola]MCO5997323.1 LuxR C-terminal-related transcriptional regulator [Actinoallomurus rhizosphaericola]